MRLSDLQTKEVVNVLDGTNLGKIIDADINEAGEIMHFVIERSKMFHKLFSGGNEILITFKDIKKIGADVILVEYKEY